MIDYTVDAEGKKTSGNIIDTVGKFTPGGEEPKAVDVTNITADVLTDLNENGGEANVSTGYHAIEFMLWGQDQDYSNFMKDSVTNGAMVAGQRPLTDYTTDKLAERRKVFLVQATKKLVADLETGGMGMFIKSELANERIAVAVLTPSEEDEHSCFSDNTHRDIVTNYEGFKNALFGTYKGKKVGEAFIDKLSKEDKAAIEALVKSIDAKVAQVDKVATTKAHFDYQIQPGSGYENNIVAMKNEMRKLGDLMIKVAEANGVSLTEEDVTDSEETKL